MKPLALGGALVGAVVGAAVWALIAAKTGYEVGYVAWGVGLAVGLGAKMLGGAGKTMGVACALIALGSIFVGKLAAVHFSVKGAAREMVEVALSVDQYNESVRDAEDFAKLQSEDEYPEFMVTHDFTLSKSADAIPEQDMAEFKSVEIPRLQKLHEEKPTYEAWKQAMAEEFATVADREVSRVEVVKENLGAIDLLFAFLGLVTAYRVGSGSEESA